MYVAAQKFCVQRSAQSLFCKNLGLNGQIVTDCVLDVECPSAAIIVEYTFAIELNLFNIRIAHYNKLKGMRRMSFGSSRHEH